MVYCKFSCGVVFLHVLIFTSYVLSINSGPTYFFVLNCHFYGIGLHIILVVH